MSLAYRRIVLKLSGEVLAGNQGFGRPCTLTRSLAVCQDGLDTDKDQREGADHDLRPPGAERPDELDQRLGHSKDHDAEERAQNIPGATGQHRTTHHYRSDDIQLEARGVQSMPGFDEKGEGKARQRRTKSVEGVHQPFRSIDGQAHQTCRLFIPAFIPTDGIDSASKARILRHINSQEEQQKSKHNRNGNIRGGRPLADGKLHQTRNEQLGLSQNLEDRVVDLNCIIADEETHPTGEPHACQRGDEGLDL